MRLLTITGFFVLVAAQWFVPLSMIKQSEDTAEQGVELKFRTRPVDPSDPFRGKYVRLAFDEETFDMDTVPQLYGGQEVFAKLKIDTSGYAVVESLSTEDPGEDALAIKVKLYNAYSDSSSQHVDMEFPFNQFYVEESKASDAERVYWDNILPTDPKRETYAVVRVLGHRAVLMDVRINDRSLLDIVREMNED
jgi:uncharacterized membrane-anchored protein